MATKHEDFLHEHCRVCSKTLRNTKYNCVKHSDLLEHLGVDVTGDDSSVHPQLFCNVCYMTAKRISRSSQKWTSLVPVQWLPHNNEMCSICDLELRGGRPKKKKSIGRPTLIQQHITSEATKIPHFVLSQVVDKTSQSDLKCTSCNNPF